VTMTPNGADAYVANAGSGTVSIINTTTLARVTVAVRSDPVAVAMEPSAEPPWG
jgi:YVTN family beta-propeller protein